MPMICHDTVSGTLGLTGAVDTILILTKKRGVCALHVRGRDLEEDRSLEMRFSRENCRWSVAGTLTDREAAQQAARAFTERAAILSTLAKTSADGLSVPEIMAATSNTNRNAVDILLFKMRGAGEVVRVKRGVYAHPEKIEENGKIERRKEATGKLLNLLAKTTIFPICQSFRSFVQAHLRLTERFHTRSARQIANRVQS